MRTDDGASPRAHINVISIIHSIADSTISNTLFSTFKFLKQSEVSRDCMEMQRLKSAQILKINKIVWIGRLKYQRLSFRPESSIGSHPHLGTGDPKFEF